MKHIKAKILLIDDEPTILLGLKKCLEQAGHTVFTAEGAAQAFDIAAREKIDIAYIDLVMPDMNGVQVCGRLKKIQPECEAVILSGAPDEIQRLQSEFFSIGGRDELLRKPLDIGEIEQVTQKIMQEKNEVE